MNGQRLKAEINLKNIVNNYYYLKSLIGDDCRLMAVVKADAYGHGAVRVSQALREVGVDFFAVACLEEGIALRDSGISEDILVLGITQPDLAHLLFEHNLIQTVTSIEYAKSITTNYPIRMHIKIDTGMSRLGIYCHSIENIKDTVNQLKVFKNDNKMIVEGIFTHFAESDNIKSSFTNNQFSIFTDLINHAEAQGLHLGIKHCCNSGGVLNFPHMKLDLVRIGIALYGLTPGPSDKSRKLKSAMALKCKIVGINTLNPGDSISYNRTFTAKNKMKVASLSIGYADGFSRVLSNKACLKVNNKSAKILGNICMDLCVVDVTNIDCKLFDEVVVFETAEEINQLASLEDTINYEVICNWAARMDRIYINN